MKFMSIWAIWMERTMSRRQVGVVCAVGTAVALAITPSWSDAAEYAITDPRRRLLVIGWYTLVGVGAACALATLWRQ